MRGFEQPRRAAQCRARDIVTNRGSPRLTNRGTGALRVTHGEGAKGKKGKSEGEKTVAGLSLDAARENFFTAGRGMKLVTVSVEV